MVCDGPDPTENNPQELIPPPRHELVMNGNGDESDDDHEYFGYEPLAQGPEVAHSDRDSDEEVEDVASTPESNVPSIEPMENVLTREVWNAPRNADPIQMDNERAQQVMSAMANFALPQDSIPEWAQCVNEEQWKQTLKDRIDKIKNNR